MVKGVKEGEHVRLFARGDLDAGQHGQVRAGDGLRGLEDGPESGLPGLEVQKYGAPRRKPGYAAGMGLRGTIPATERRNAEQASARARVARTWVRRPGDSP